MKLTNHLIVIALLSIAACDTIKNKTEQVNETIEGLEKKYAPDKRIAVFSVEAVQKNGEILVEGVSNVSEAIDSLRQYLRNHEISFEDQIRMLPSEDLEGKIFGLVKISVANLRGEPRHSAELVTQATLGTPLNVLDKQRGWYLVQTPDDYIAWVDSGGLELLTKDEIDEWNATQKLIYLMPFGFSYEKPAIKAQTVSDLVSGNILIVNKEAGEFYEVQYPDSTVAYIKKEEAQLYNEWLNKINPTAESLVETSKKLMGLPYLWGGTSFKGVDCSGFTKTVYFLNGMIIPRDASQQVQTGKFIDSTRNFENLQPGDLLFFGRRASEKRPERIVHVGMWIGNNEFIHSAGSVHISSVDSTADNFDPYNYERYLRSKRLLQQPDENLIHLVEGKVFNIQRPNIENK